MTKLNVVDISCITYAHNFTLFYPSFSGIKISGPGLMLMANSDPTTGAALNYCTLSATGLVNMKN